MRRFTISMAMFNSYVSDYQRVRLFPPDVIASTCFRTRNCNRSSSANRDVLWWIIISLVVCNIFYFLIYWECHHPNWRTHIFQWGRYTTNQIIILGINWMGWGSWTPTTAITSRRPKWAPPRGVRRALTRGAIREWYGMICSEKHDSTW